MNTNMVSADPVDPLKQHFAWNQNASPVPESAIHEMVAATAAAMPHAVALRFAGKELRYAELDARANGLAHLLRDWGVGSDVPVGVALERGFDMVVAVLAVLKAGGAYVPLDPAYPAQRLAYMLRDCKAPILLTQTSLRKNFLPIEGLRSVCLDSPGNWPAPRADAPAVDVAPQDLAYVIYTSGSTGLPKGVAMSHGPVCNLLHWQRASLAAEGAAGLCTLQYTSLSFDVSVQEIFSTLVEGGTLQLIDEYERRDSLTLLNVILKQQVQRLFLPFVALDALCHAAMQSGLVPLSVRRVMTAGEQLRVSPAGVWLFSRLEAVLHNQYGPTETCIIDSEWILRPPANQWPTLPPIGIPIANVSFWVMDEQGRALPVGEPGELWHGGACLARGYLGQEALTADRFVPHPFVPGERLYRSGDLVCRRTDGALEFLGRMDQQVKLRGFRVELGEVEAVIASHPAVREVLVQVLDAATKDAPLGRNGRDERRLAAFVAVSAMGVTTPADLQSQALGALLRPYLRDRLPEYMVPDVFVCVQALPRTPSGKLDRQALFALPSESPLPSGPGWTSHASEVTDPLELQLLEIWREVLGRGDLGVQDSLFDAGGHSLLAARLRSVLQERLGGPVALRLLFEYPCVRELAAVLRKAPGQGLAAPGAHEDVPPGTSPRQDLLPLSYAQQAMWLAEQIQGAQGTYNVSLALQLQGSLDVPALRHALTDVVRRHEVLRTRLVEHKTLPRQWVDPAPVELLALGLTDLRGHPDNSADAWLLEHSAQPLDLEHQGPLLLFLARTGASQWLLLLNIHHAAIDGWSIEILLAELHTLYAAAVAGPGETTAGLPRLSMQYADFAQWQRQRLAGAHLLALLDYWTGQLQGAPQRLELPTDRPRPPQQSHRGACVDFVLSPALASQVTHFARQEKATPFMVVMAIWASLLGRYSRVQDLLVGSPVANRPHHALEPLIGMFVNTLALRITLSQNLGLRGLLAQVRSTCLEGFSHQELPFEQVVEALHVERSLAWEPLCQVLLAWQIPDPHRVAMPGLECKIREIHNGTAKYDLLLSITEGNEGWHARLEYALDLFLPETAERMAGHFVRLLSAALDEPDKPLHTLPLLDPAEWSQQLARDTASGPGGQGTVHQRFAAMASQQPQATALRFGTLSLSYAELDARANGLAHRLCAWGVGPDVPVGLALERGFEMVVAMLAVLKAGGAYVPLDPAYPAQRLAYMLEDCAAPVLLTQSTLQDKLPQREGLITLFLDVPDAMPEPRTDAPVVNVSPQNLAYVMYTSGSTGQPKGVAVPHQGVVRLAAENSAFCMGPEDIVLQFASFAFDAATLEIWGALLNGACIALHPPGMPSTAELAQFLVTQKVSFAWLTSALFHLMVDEQPMALAGVRQLLSGGDVLSSHHVLRLLALMPPEHALINGYGPTENTTFTCCHRMQGGATPKSAFERSVPIGRPIAYTDVWVLDENLQPLPVGIAGELYTGGLGLARGYWGQPTLTAQRFVAHPWREGERLFRTGDQVRWRADRTLEFLGRLDQQVKLRGFRIELGEIESALRKHASVRDAVVVMHEPDHGERRLVAYVVAAPDQHQPDGEYLRDFLQHSLPDYMLPSVYVLLEALPVTRNGKLDYDALPAPSAPQSNATAVADSLLEVRLLELWRDALGLARLGKDDNFFASGGHSLVAARLAQRIHKVLGLEIQVAQFFSTQTVAEMASRLQHGDQPHPWSSVVAMQTRGTCNPLFFFHGWGGGVYTFVPMAQELAPEQPVYGIQAQGLDGLSPVHERIEDMASHYADQLLSMHTGPFRLAGFSLGGWIVWATATELLRRGAQVEVLVMLDVHSSADMPLWVRVGDRLLHMPLRSLPLRGLRWLRRRTKAVLRTANALLFTKALTAVTTNTVEPCRINLAHSKYRPTPLPVKVEMLFPSDTSSHHFWYWRFMAKKGCTLHKMPIDDHLAFYEGRHARLLARQLHALLNDRVLK